MTLLPFPGTKGMSSEQLFKANVLMTLVLESHHGGQGVKHLGTTARWADMQEEHCDVVSPVSDFRLSTTAAIPAVCRVSPPIQHTCISLQLLTPLLLLT
jgi:hypothetical protein